MADPHSFDFPRQACAQSLAARFEEIAREAPGRLALRHGARSVMYDELNRQSNRLAHALLGQLTGEDATILLLLRDPIHHVVAQLGVVKTGRACVPVDVSFPVARQRQITADSAARLVVAELETLESALGLGYERGSVVIVDDLRSGLSEKNPGLPVSPTHWPTCSTPPARREVQRESCSASKTCFTSRCSIIAISASVPRIASPARHPRLTREPYGLCSRR